MRINNVLRTLKVRLDGARDGRTSLYCSVDECPRWSGYEASDAYLAWQRDTLSERARNDGGARKPLASCGGRTP